MVRIDPDPAVSTESKALRIFASNLASVAISAINDFASLPLTASPLGTCFLRDTKMRSRHQADGRLWVGGARLWAWQGCGRGKAVGERAMEQGCGRRGCWWSKAVVAGANLWLRAGLGQLTTTPLTSAAAAGASPPLRRLSSPAAAAAGATAGA